MTGPTPWLLRRVEDSSTFRFCLYHGSPVVVRQSLDLPTLYVRRYTAANTSKITRTSTLKSYSYGSPLLNRTHLREGTVIKEAGWPS
jgi:hypothetical protein